MGNCVISCCLSSYITMEKVVTMMKFEIQPRVKYLLIPSSPERVTMAYQQFKWKQPIIAKRPPYYAHPRYEPYYPLV